MAFRPQTFLCFQSRDVILRVMGDMWPLGSPGDAGRHESLCASLRKSLGPRSPRVRTGSSSTAASGSGSCFYLLMFCSALPCRRHVACLDILLSAAEDFRVSWTFLPPEPTHAAHQDLDIWLHAHNELCSGADCSACVVNSDQLGLRAFSWARL